MATIFIWPNLWFFFFFFLNILFTLRGDWISPVFIPPQPYLILIHQVHMLIGVNGPMSCYDKVFLLHIINDVYPSAWRGDRVICLDE